MFDSFSNERGGEYEVKLLSNSFFQPFQSLYDSKYLRMDQVKFVEDCL